MKPLEINVVAKKLNGTALDYWNGLSEFQSHSYFLIVMRYPKVMFIIVLFLGAKNKNTPTYLHCTFVPTFPVGTHPAHYLFNIFFHS